MSVTSGIRFELQNILRYHTKPINHLAISPDYSRLISIGDDARAVVWSVASGEKLFIVERNFNGPAMAASWVSRDTSRFVIGFANGDLHLFYGESGKLYRDNVGIAGGGGAVEGIMYDATHDRIASICEKTTQLWRIKETELIPILQSPLMSEGYGKCVQFCDNRANVVMYYLDTHECVCYSIEPWEKRWSKKLTSRIGYATLNHDGKLLLVSNLKDGIDEYHFLSMEKVQTFSHPIETNCIIQSRSLPSWNLIVTGGDGGFARVFNRISGQLVAEIHHGARGELIQVVETPDENSRFMAANESIRPLEFDDDEEDEEMYNAYDDDQVEEMCDAAGSGRLLIGRHTYSHIVHAASEAATVAALRVLRSEAKNSSPGIPAPGHPDSDRNELGTGLLKPFEATCAKKRVRRPNHDKLVDNAMRKFLEDMGVLTRKASAKSEKNLVYLIVT
ncbi:WD40-repeat-containing domain protein [Russula brevipes]|nr:WD40-repeat-containing domain protein [Russula brevipes]